MAQDSTAVSRGTPDKEYTDVNRETRKTASRPPRGGRALLKVGSSELARDNLARRCDKLPARHGRVGTLPRGGADPRAATRHQERGTGKRDRL
jgi:hypothetical protein